MDTHMPHSISLHEEGQICSLQRTWRLYAARHMRGIRKLVLAMDALRLTHPAPPQNSTATISLFTQYLTHLLHLCHLVHRQHSHEHILLATRSHPPVIRVLLSGVISGSKVTRLLAKQKRQAPTKYLWDAFEAAHMHLQGSKGHPCLRRSALLTPELALAFLDASALWLQSHAELEAFKHAIAASAIEWSLVAKLQRLLVGSQLDDVSLASSYEHAFFQSHGLTDAMGLTPQQYEAAERFLPLPNPGTPIVSLDDPSTCILWWQGISVKALNGSRHAAEEAALVHALLVNPAFQLPASLPLDLTAIYTRVPHSMDTHLDLRAAREAMWRTVAAELAVGVVDRAFAIYRAITAGEEATASNSPFPYDADALRALLEKREMQLASEANGRLQQLREAVLQDGSGPGYEAQLFELGLEQNRIVLSHTTEWLRNVLRCLSLSNIQKLAQCDPLTLKETHAFAIVATLMYPELLRVHPPDDASQLLQVETLRFDMAWFNMLSVATAALVKAFQSSCYDCCAAGADACSTIHDSSSRETVVLFLTCEAIGSSSSISCEQLQLLYTLDEWALTARVSDLVRINAKVHWSIYLQLLPLLAEQQLLPPQAQHA